MGEGTHSYPGAKSPRGCRMATGDAESPNNVASTFFQYSTFASERP